MARKIIIGDMIRYFLKENGMTMKQLGDKLNKSESNVSKWISGSSTPQAKELAEMTFIFETDLNTLMFGNEDILFGKIYSILKELDYDHRNKVYDYAKFQLSEQTKEQEL